MVTEEIVVGKNAAAGYGSRALWSGANFSIGKGEFVAVLGPNGAGKTTLFRLLLGLAQPLEGDVRVFGEKPHRGNPKIGYVPQRHVFDPDLRLEVLEIVRLGSCGGKWGFDTPAQAELERGKALEALRIVDADSLAHRSIGVLSGGEMQRVFLAQALAGEPDLLLLDEPLANLDIRREGELVQLIERIVKKRGVTVLLIAHNINPLLPVLDRVMYIAGGKVAIGNPGDVLNSETLSRLYDSPVEVLKDSRGRVAIVGVEEAIHHHE